MSNNGDTDDSSDIRRTECDDSTDDNSDTGYVRHTKCDDGHEEHLQPIAEEDRKKHSLAGRTEDVTMDQLPTKLLLCVLLNTHTPLCVTRPHSNL